MRWYKKILLAQTNQVQGPPIDKLIETVQMMFAGGAPNVWDDVGFNKIHYNSPQMRQVASAIPGQPLPVDLVIWVLDALVFFELPCPEGHGFSRTTDQCLYI